MIPAALAVLLLVIVILLFTVKIRRVDVTGNSHYSAEQIEELIFHGKWSRNSAFFYYENRFKEHQSIPFIEEYKVNFKSPTHVEIVVFEKSVVGYVSYMSSYMYFDKDGIIVESSGEQLPGVPWVTGLEFGHIVLHQPLPVADQSVFEKVLNLTQVLSVNGIAVDKINYDNFGEAELTMGDVAVVLGSDQDINGKITELKGILPELEGLSGTLYLDTYDVTNSNPTYTFVKKEAQ